MLKNFLKLGIYSILLIAVSCANPGTPTGGEKDEFPPVMLDAKPDNGTTNFSSNRIEIRFNELIKFKDLKKQLVISPPMKHDPQIRPGGSASDRIRIKIIDTLAENTTYTINFGNSIEDNNESNPYPNFRYVFSTGDYVDSLSLEGKITDAFNEEFPKNVMVVLYEVDSTYNDSTIFKEIPRYVTNTIESDTFRIDNLKAGKYKLFAFEEKSSNLKYNPGQDRMAFYPQTITVPDSNKYLLKIFGEIPEFALKRPVHKSKGLIEFTFDRGSDDLEIERIFPLKSDTVRDLLTYSEYRDTASYWFSARESDSLLFSVKSPKYEIDDTLRVSLKNQKDLNPEFKIINQSNLSPSNRLSLRSSFPITSFKKDSISLMSLTDSSEIYFEISKSGLTDLKLDFEPKYGEEYELSLLPGAVRDFFEFTNDTIVSKIKVKKKMNFGEIIFTINNVETYPIIVQLLKGNNNTVVRSIIADSADDIVFPDLNPATYKLRVIFDENANGKWDPGIYLDGKMPEGVKYFPDEIELKANWDIQQTWNLAN